VCEICPRDVLAACEQTRHALTWPAECGGAELRRSVAETVEQVVNWHPNFPLVDSLYAATEELGRPPLWDELITMWRGDGPLRYMLGSPHAAPLARPSPQGIAPLTRTRRCGGA
jgi:hypothetical protein